MTQKELKNLELLLEGVEDIKNGVEHIFEELAPKSEGEAITTTALNTMVVGNKLTSLICDIKKSIDEKQLTINNQW